MILNHLDMPGVSIPRPRGRGLGILRGEESGFTLPTRQDIQEWTTALNAEALYITNLIRQARGEPPVPPAYAAPQFNVGVTPETRNLILIAVFGALGYMMFMRGRGAQRSRSRARRRRQRR